MSKNLKILKVRHPSGDGTYVEFRGLTTRQLEVLEDYIEYWEFKNPPKPKKNVRGTSTRGSSKV